MHNSTTTITLPPRSDGRQPATVETAGRLLIIGANGSGKTRFSDRMAADLGETAFCISPISALYGSAADDNRPGIDSVYAAMRHTSPLIMPEGSPVPPSQLEKLMALLLNEEVANLIRYKVAHASSPDTVMQPTRLDTVIERWKEMFPDNDVLIEGGKILFSRTADCDARPSIKLSAGEKVILYYFGAVLYAPANAVIMVDNPGMFLHPSVIRRLWDSIEALRPDCRFVYTTHDLDFASSRPASVTCWVRDFNAAECTWDYDLLPPDSELTDELYLTILGDRRPVLFIEGDAQRSIDARLYPLIFTDYTVKSLGSCDRVIESTRVFNSLASFHHLDSYGIVDRDRRTEKEVEYLRNKKVLVSEAAEIENMLMLEEVIRTVASSRNRDENKAFNKVRNAVMAMFERELRQQALLHTRHYVKRTVEHRIDGKFRNITRLEEHMSDLVNEINPRAIYDNFCREFHDYLNNRDYKSILRVFNQKSMLTETNVATICGTRDKQNYIDTIIGLLKKDGAYASRLRHAIIRSFGLDAPLNAKTNDTK
ncbi:MAG: DUF4435 domain-containing protein [Muribaculaceae bacterium]|nr:DUF4435 domain-containing protein [Muribaculaceae bacterium]